MGKIVSLPSAVGPITAPEKLTQQHALIGFDCGEEALNNWLARRALANQARGASRTYVICEQGVVVGYYCLSAGAVARNEAPPSLRRNMPDPIPIMVLGRLAVHRERAGQGLGSDLLRDAILRTVQASEIAGIAALLVHALNDRAAEFYERKGFERSPLRNHILMLPLSALRANLRWHDGQISRATPLFLQLEAIEHKRTRVSRPQSNGIVERLHRTLPDEHFRVEGRKTWFETIEEMQTVLDAYLVGYNTRRPHQGRGTTGRTPAKAFRDGITRNSKKEDKTELKTAAWSASRRWWVAGDIHFWTYDASQ
jgi:transposase InsO family protein